jgi:hypothetical protein
VNEHGEPDEHDARERDEQEHDERARRAERRRRTMPGEIFRIEWHAARPDDEPSP